VTWRIAFLPTAERHFDDLDKPVKVRIARSLERLREYPLSSPNVRALTGGGYWLRAGDWRVVFAFDGTDLLVTVIRIAHRRDVSR
jgi:mRNA interferase RelE/StbE